MMKHICSFLLFLSTIVICWAQESNQLPEIKFIHLTDLHVSVGNDNDFLLK